jgi:hypothetical protein
MMENSEAHLAVENIVRRHVDQMFEEFDNLHKQGINDTDVTRNLHDLGYNNLAADYIDWQNGGAEPREDEDGPFDQGEHLVTDPGDAPSYTDMHTAKPDNWV